MHGLGEEGGREGGGKGNICVKATLVLVNEISYIIFVLNNSADNVNPTFFASQVAQGLVGSQLSLLYTALLIINNHHLREAPVTLDLTYKLLLTSFWKCSYWYKLLILIWATKKKGITP